MRTLVKKVGPWALGWYIMGTLIFIAIISLNIAGVLFQQWGSSASSLLLSVLVGLNALGGACMMAELERCRFDKERGVDRFVGWWGKD
jgi:hypothetical protein